MLKIHTVERYFHYSRSSGKKSTCCAKLVCQGYIWKSDEKKQYLSKDIEKKGFQENIRPLQNTTRTV